MEGKQSKVTKPKKVHKTVGENITETTKKTKPKRKAESMEIDDEQEAEQPQVQDVPLPAQPRKVARVSELRRGEHRIVNVPSHRVTPLRENWAKISDIILDTLKLGLRYDIKTRKLKIHLSNECRDTTLLQRAADYVQAFVYGFSVADAEALVRCSNIYVDTFDVKDVRQTLKSDHVGRAVGRMAGHNGKTRYMLENATKTRIIIADTRVHILGAYENVRICKRSLCALILGSPIGKVTGNLKALKEKTSV